jgi:hypothetical protein
MWTSVYHHRGFERQGWWPCLWSINTDELPDVFPYFLRCVLYGSSQFNSDTDSTPCSEFTSELYRPSDRHLLAKLVSTFTDRGCHVVSVTAPYGRILGFLARNRFFFLPSSSSVVLMSEWTPSTPIQTNLWRICLVGYRKHKYVFFSLFLVKRLMLQFECFIIIVCPHTALVILRLALGETLLEPTPGTLSFVPELERRPYNFTLCYSSHTSTLRHLLCS